jgi:hypothetical protein
MTTTPGLMPENKRRFPFLSSVRRHKRLIAFIGATLVLGNYIVGDRLRESAKDAAEDARSSASELRTQIILDNILGTVHTIDEHQEAVTTEAVRDATQHGPVPVKPITVDDVRQAFDEIDASTRGQEYNTVEMIRQFDDQFAHPGRSGSRRLQHDHPRTRFRVVEHAELASAARYCQVVFDPQGSGSGRPNPDRFRRKCAQRIEQAIA